MTNPHRSLGSVSSKVISPAIVLLLLLLIGCGAAATATPVPTSRPPSATVAPAATVAVATATPVSTPVPAKAVVNPGKLTWMIGSFGHERFDPNFGSSVGHDYARQVHAYLIASDAKDGRRVFIPGIATKWGVSSDGLTWTFTMRKGVKFHDGTEVTVEDVLWSLQHTIGPEVKKFAPSPSPVASFTDRIEQTGPDQVSVTTKVPMSDLAVANAEASGNWTGVVFPKRATLHNVEDEAAYDRNPIGAGILRLVKHVPADSMTFERFADHYYQPKNGFPTDKRVNFTVLDLRLVPEEATRVAALRAGDADIAPVTLGARKQVEAGGGRLVFGQEGAYFWVMQLGCMQAQFPCHDRRVRQALNYAIDKQVLQNQLYGAEVMQVTGWGSVSPSTIGYSPELAPYPYDPAKARQLLADAGYAGGKGFGKLVINTYVSPALPLMSESAQLAADFWRRELGLDVEVRVGDQAALKKDARLTENLYGQILWRDNETKLDATGSLRTGYAATDRKDTLHNDPELFDVTNKALAVFDPVEREKVLNSAYRRMRDEAYEIPIGNINIPWGVGRRIQTWQPYPLSFYPSALHTITIK
ncbi:MAG: ABC transporter substrate-binding protein [Dehalococcoidia bacterium]|nr:ABC transporter substrate-binding protein [Dehalococcoidia bacterium]